MDANIVRKVLYLAVLATACLALEVFASADASPVAASPTAATASTAQRPGFVQSAPLSNQPAGAPYACPDPPPPRTQASPRASTRPATPAQPLVVTICSPTINAPAAGAVPAVVSVPYVPPPAEAAASGPDKGSSGAKAEGASRARVSFQGMAAEFESSNSAFMWLAIITCSMPIWVALVVLLYRTLFKKEPAAKPIPWGLVVAVSVLSGLALVLYLWLAPSGEQKDIQRLEDAANKQIQQFEATRRLTESAAYSELASQMNAIRTELAMLSAQRAAAPSPARAPEGSDLAVLGAVAIAAIALVGLALFFGVARERNSVERDQRRHHGPSVPLTPALVAVLDETEESIDRVMETIAKSRFNRGTGLMAEVDTMYAAFAKLIRCLREPSASEDDSTAEQAVSATDVDKDVEARSKRVYDRATQLRSVLVDADALLGQLRAGGDAEVVRAIEQAFRRVRRFVFGLRFGPPRLGFGTRVGRQVPSGPEASSASGEGSG